VEITEIRIKLMDDPGDRLRAFCSITLDGAFVIRDLKIIEGPNGLFVAMPSRKLTARCPQCSCKNHLRSYFCNQCGARLEPRNAPRGEDGRAKLYADIAHPIHSECRDKIQQQLVKAYDDEMARSQLPGYVPSYSDYELEVEDLPQGDYLPGPAAAQRPNRPRPGNYSHRPGPRGPHKPPQDPTRTTREGHDHYGAAGY